MVPGVVLFGRYGTIERGGGPTGNDRVGVAGVCAAGRDGAKSTGAESPARGCLTTGTSTPPNSNSLAERVLPRCWPVPRVADLTAAEAPSREYAASP